MALADFDALRLWEPLGYPSLFDFVHRELGVSRSAAYYRITAARLVREYPEIVQPLRDGRLCVTNVVELSKAITPENKDQSSRATTGSPSSRLGPSRSRSVRWRSSRRAR